MNIKDYMTAPALTIPPEMTIPEARGLLKARHFRHLPVAGPDGRLLGMVTDRDLRSAYPSTVLCDENTETRLAELQRTPVSAIMSRDFYTLPPEATLDDALLLLDRKNIGALPVVDEAGRVSGIFSIRDLIRAYRELFGLGEPGSAMLTVTDDGQPHPLTRISKVLEEAGVRCDRLLRHQEIIYLRLNTCNLAPLRAALKQAGFKQIGEKPL